MKPMLSAKLDCDSEEVLLEQLNALRYPVVCSPKVDGIRVLVHPDLGPVTRKLKPVPNQYVREMLYMQQFFGLDGEITVGPNYSSAEHGDVFNRTTAIMARDGTPDFVYWVFDHFESPNDPYQSRLQAAQWVAEKHPDYHIRALEAVWCGTPTDVLQYEDMCIEYGYEGVMIRDPEAPYKFNRSTLKQGHLIKLKRVTDAEAEIIGVEPRMRNDNEQVRDELGYAKRSAHQNNKTPVGMVGKLICRSPNFSGVFGIGSGFDHATATEWWNDRDKLLGKVVTFKYQACGTLDLPRHPIFKGFRED